MITVADDIKTSLVFKILLVLYDNVLEVKLMTYGSKNITEGNVLYVWRIDEKKTRYMSIFLFSLDKLYIAIWAHDIWFP